MGKEDNEKGNGNDYHKEIEKTLQECQSKLKGHPRLISRSFKAVNASQDGGESKTKGVLRVLQYNILADGSCLIQFCSYPKIFHLRNLGRQ